MNEVAEGCVPPAEMDFFENTSKDSIPDAKYYLVRPKGSKTVYSLSIEKRVINIVNDVLGVEASVEDTFDDLYVDSLDLVEIIIECEQEFGYPIKDDKAQNLKTVGDLVNLIKDLDNKDYLESTQADLQVDE